MKTPAWWYRPSLFARLLAPLGWLYYAIAVLRRALTQPKTPAIPTLCIGNVVAGGGGKTPVAVAIGQWCKAQNINAFFVSRGYGGSMIEPTLISTHTAAEAGDEPLLLVRILPTVVGKNRAAAVAFAATQGATLAILDDGFQNPSIQKTASILVLKGDHPLGNGQLIPAGPLREPLETALKRAQAVVWVDAPTPQTLPISTPIFTATTTLSLPTEIKKAVAFAGIALPELFKQAIEGAGVEVIHFAAFADHHAFKANEIADLQTRAKEHGATLVTTEKDWVRLPKAIQAEVVPLPLSLTFDDAAGFAQWLSHHATVS
jgi:tetraacyldisaccharide 4'-kinase